MRKILKVTIITCMVILIVIAGLSATAAKPAYTGVKMPPAVDGKTGAVTGRVTSASNATAGMAGAYIAVVNASNASEEYANTTADASGYYQILGINASYNATNASDVGPNGATPYRIYADNGVYGDGYSAAFGIDSSSPGTGGGGIPPVAVSTPTATAIITSTPVPTATAVPTTTPTTTPMVGTSTPPATTPTPVPTPYVLPAIVSLLISVSAAAWMFSKKN